MAEPAKCGTLSDYSRHIRLREPTCQKCRDCMAAYNRSRTGGTRRQPAECGTRAGASRHQRLGEKLCDTCREVERQRSLRRYYDKRRDNPDTVAQHRLYVAARGRALSRLAERYPTEMAELLREELVPDVVVRKPWKWKPG